MTYFSKNTFPEAGGDLFFKNNFPAGAGRLFFQK
jgi:hypothetical protein